MPRFDRTGPMGQGPMTGRGMGPCSGYGRGGGRGFGWRRFGDYRYYQPQITEKEELELLKDEQAALEDELKGIKERLAKIKGQK